ncbi:MAG: hypothetical protein WA484_09890 [Solirubrobacteraceae bacterium]
MTQALTLTARYETVEKGWVQATIDELPGVITAGPSHAEAEELLADALHSYLLALGDLEQRTDEVHSGEAVPLRITVGA